MRLSRGHLVLSIAGTTAFLIFSAWLYDYGKPIGYQLTGTQLDGTIVELPNEWVHLAYTPQYSLAMNFRAFVDSVGVFIYSFGIASGYASPFIREFAKWLSWYLTAGKYVKSDKDASGFPFYGFFEWS